MNRNQLCRDLLRCVCPGEPIKHTIPNSNGDGHILCMGIFDEENNGLVSGNTFYPTLNQFTTHNYTEFRPDRRPGNNAWSECKIYRDNQWISMYDLPEL